MPAQPAAPTFSRFLQDGIKNLPCSDRGFAAFRAARVLGLSSHPSVGNHLVIALVALGDLPLARQVYDALLLPDHLSWAALTSGYVQCKRPLDAIRMFYQRIGKEESDGRAIRPHHFTSYLCVSLLKACAEVEDVQICVDVHSKIVSVGLFQSNGFVGSALIHMYAKCGFLCKAKQVFDVIPIQDVVVWTTLINGYVESGYGDEAFRSYHQMCVEGITPNAPTLICLLKAAIISGNLGKGVGLHIQIEGLGGILESKPHLGSALVDMYAKLGSLDYAERVFHELRIQDIVAWTALIHGYAENGYGKEAFDCFERMQREGITPKAATFVCGLKACHSISAAANKVRDIHAEVERKGFLEENHIIGVALISAYMKCGLHSQAREVFDKLPNKDVVSWTALIGGYVEHGHDEDAVRCFSEMKLQGIIPNPMTFVCILKACRSIANAITGQRVCAEIEIQGLHWHRFVGSAMIDMLAKHGSLALAQALFDRIPYQDEVVWTSLIVGYCEHGYGEEVLMLLEHMELENVCPNAVLYICCLKACGQTQAIDKGHEMHAQVEKRGFIQRELAVGNALVDMYTKCGFVDVAQKVVDNLPGRNVISWTTLIAAYVEHDCFDEALECFNKMQFEGFTPNNATFDCILKICSSVGAVGKGQGIHSEIERQGLVERDPEIGNTMITMYTDFGMLEKAREVFERFPHRNTASWNALLAGYTEQGILEEAMRCLKQMILERVNPDDITLFYALKICGIAVDVEMGREIHAQCVEDSMEGEMSVSSGLVDMYGKCGFLASSVHVFHGLPQKDIVLWTALISGYGEQGRGEDALRCFTQMQAEGILANAVSVHCILKVCRTLRAINKGRELHAMYEGNKLLSDPYISSMLVDMYANCGSLATAQKAFDRLEDRDVVSWTTLLTRYEEHGYAEEAIQCFRKMEAEAVPPNMVTFVACVKGCGSMGALDAGIELHAKIEKRGLIEMGELIGNTLVCMYANCGALDASQRVFESLPVCGLVSWNALITGYAKIGAIEDVFLAFNRMMMEHVEPDSITFLVVLSACNRRGVLYGCQTCFESMSRQYGISPRVEHHTCIVDAFGRVGQLEKVMFTVKEMPFDPDPAVYHAVLRASRQWGHVNLGEQAFADSGLP